MPTHHSWVGSGNGARFSTDAEHLGTFHDWTTNPPGSDVANAYNGNIAIFNNGGTSKQSFFMRNDGVTFASDRWIALTIIGTIVVGASGSLAPFISGTGLVNTSTSSATPSVTAYSAAGSCNPSNLATIEFGWNYSPGNLFPNTTLDTGSSSIVSWAYPTVTGIDIASGPSAGGTVVVISGTEFFNVTSITFGGTAATSIVPISTTSVRCTTPAHTAGAVDIVVRNTYLDSSTEDATLVGGYTYLPPPVTITITGSGGSQVAGSSPLGLGTGGSGGVEVSGVGSGPMAYGAGAPPELHINQWGLEQFVFRARLEERI